MTDERNDLLRTFKAFSCANAALRNHPNGDNRSEADIEEADRLIAWITSQRRQDEIDEKDAAQASRIASLEAGREADGERIKQLEQRHDALMEMYVEHMGGNKKLYRSLANMVIDNKLATLAATAQKGEQHD